MNPIPHKDLSKEAPRSPRQRISGYVILARTLDKCRADIAGKVGEYHFDCPLDNMLFGFKGVKGADFRTEVETGAGDDAMANWIEANGTEKSAQEVKEWSNEREKYSMYSDPEKREFFVAECQKLGLDPAKTTLFDWLEADDKASYSE
ncbi:MAG: DUF5069 domain-containing protein [Verrucomicrobiota bacterium]|nr:DUF5069 domain-containing protein [Verrucomicrobiota bacterium]